MLLMFGIVIAAFLSARAVMNWPPRKEETFRVQGHCDVAHKPSYHVAEYEERNDVLTQQKHHYTFVIGDLCVHCTHRMGTPTSTVRKNDAKSNNNNRNKRRVSFVLSFNSPAVGTEQTQENTRQTWQSMMQILMKLWVYLTKCVYMTAVIMQSLAILPTRIRTP
uniref:Secreted protein n=1 Tax=Trypanosoma congolense (strain IL3000) TaxID=1068625 RepID=G0UTA7_TRYCI|nr:hypothetical protein TCIL3000_9_140 [Trypanosoma congolense IL3000]